jgi:hypothetical protein
MTFPAINEADSPPHVLPPCHPPVFSRFRAASTAPWFVRESSGTCIVIDNAAVGAVVRRMRGRLRGRFFIDASV